MFHYQDANSKAEHRYPRSIEEELYESTTDTKFNAAVFGSVYLGRSVRCAERGDGSCRTVYVQLQQIRAGVFLFITIFDLTKIMGNRSRGA